MFVLMQSCVFLLQEALEALGFYSGEEDMEYSVFDAGTERAVKTWQVSSCYVRTVSMEALVCRQRC